jgi:hypothetical protein
MNEDHDYIVNMHNLGVDALYKKMVPLLEEAGPPVAMHTLMILLSMIGQQADMEPEHFKAFVVTELDRLMAIEEKRDE